jgi:SlyX protein
MNNDRLTDLEIKLAFQEDLVDSLNQVVTAQQRELELLQGQVRLLYQQLKSLQPSDIASVDEEAPPPHY